MSKKAPAAPSKPDTVADALADLLSRGLTDQLLDVCRIVGDLHELNQRLAPLQRATVGVAVALATAELKGLASGLRVAVAADVGPAVEAQAGQPTEIPASTVPCS
jgi:hypothetical protein